MPVILQSSITGYREIVSNLKGVNPARNTRIVTRAFNRFGLLVQRIAASEKIRRGGQGPPLKTKLTSRTGTLRRSIRVDKGGIPRFVEIGSDLLYAPVHELGLTVDVRAHSRRSKKTKKTFAVKAHRASFPRRPFLAPAFADAKRSLEDIFEESWQHEIERALGRIG